jgi:hypothetical protein
MSEAGSERPIEAGGTAGGRSFGSRLLGALRLEAGAYDEIAADSSALGQAAGVALAAAVARAIGAAPGSTSAEPLIGAVSVLLFWPVCSTLIWLIANWFGHRTGLAPMLRVVGFAMAPLILAALLVVNSEWVQISSSLLATALFFAALVVAVRQALRVDTGRAAFVCLTVAMIVVFLLMVVMFVAARPSAS